MLQKYRVWIRSKPGMWEIYRGKVDVYAANERVAITAAVRELATGTFKDRGFDAWVCDGVECLG